MNALISKSKKWFTDILSIELLVSVSAAMAAGAVGFPPGSPPQGGRMGTLPGGNAPSDSFIDRTAFDAYCSVSTSFGCAAVHGGSGAKTPDISSDTDSSDETDSSAGTLQDRSGALYGVIGGIIALGCIGGLIGDRKRKGKHDSNH